MEWMQAAPGARETEVFVWSGWNDGPHRDRAKRAGADRYFEKQNGMEGLEELVRACCKKPYAKNGARAKKTA